MRREAKLLGPLTLGLLTACASTSAAPERHGESAARAVPPGQVLTGASTWSMAAQYAPRAGAVAGTGASAWVGAPPPPAFTLAGPLPPADPPPPPLAAVANRQPGSQAPAADAPRPEAAAPEGPAPAAPASPALRERGLALFNDWACGTCHALADAGASGAIGPSLDRNPQLTRDLAASVIGQGRGAMPGFGGLMSEEEIATLADYIVQFARR